MRWYLVVVGLGILCSLVTIVLWYNYMFEAGVERGKRFAHAPSGSVRVEDYTGTPVPIAYDYAVRAPSNCKRKLAKIEGRGTSTRIDSSSTRNGDGPERFGFADRSCELDQGEYLCWSEGRHIVETCLDGSAP